MYYTVDRIEEDTAVLEDDGWKMLNVKLQDLPADLREGDVLRLTDGVYEIDAELTRKRRKSLEARFNRLFID